MKRVRLDRWATQIQPPRNPRLPLQQCPFSSHQAASEGRRRLQPRRPLPPTHCQHRPTSITRQYASSASAVLPDDADARPDTVKAPPPRKQQIRKPLFAPSHQDAIKSAKLNALHSRLALPAKLPVQTLARCLVDPSADPRQGYNNAPFATLGQDLLGYYTTEYLMTRYPRLPMAVLFAAQFAYTGNQTLGAMRSEWGVEVAAEPGKEVDAGLLQLKRTTPGNSMAEDHVTRIKDMPQTRRLGTGRAHEQFHYRRGISSRIVYDDQFGDLQQNMPTGDTPPYPGAPISTSSKESDSNTAEAEETALFAPQTPDETSPTTVEAASASFIRALCGALYLHAGSSASKQFHKDHVLSRHLALHTLFNFTVPTRDLSRLCLREGFEPPVARIISETGRLSRTPVYVVGVYSGEDKLGEGAGASLDEARVRAAAAALRSWYLYSPPESDIMLPSSFEGLQKGVQAKTWKPQMVDPGEVVF